MNTETTEAQSQRSEQQQEWKTTERGLDTGIQVFAMSAPKADAIRSTHNSALVIAYKDRDEWKRKAWNEIQHLERVISETHKAHRIELERLRENQARELNAKLDQINKQAETIKKTELARDQHEADADIFQIRLLSALAAIEKIVKAADRSPSTGIYDAIQSARNVDLSLLHEHDEKVRAEALASKRIEVYLTAMKNHDAEVREPLVALLYRIRNQCDGDDARFDKIKAMIDEQIISLDALAKVKE